MKTLFSLFAFTVTVTLGLASAAAQESRDDRAEITYDFADDYVGGELRRSLGDRLSSRGRIGRATLVRPRAHYVPEMLKSVEAL